MFGSRYFANRYWGSRYYGHFGATAAPVYGQYMGLRYFGRRYWNQKTSEVDGAYNGSRYFGNRYFGKRYFGANQTSDPFALAQTNVLAGSGSSTTSSSSFTIGTDWPVSQTNSLLGTGTSGFNTSLTFDTENWYLENYLQLAQATGSSAFATDIQLGYAAAGGRYFGYRYFGTRYYGARYWSTLTGWSLEITQHLSGVGVPTHSAAIGLPLTFTPSSVIFGSAAGVVGSVSLTFVEPPPIVDPPIVPPSETDSPGGYPAWLKRKPAKKPKAEEKEEQAEIVVIEPVASEPRKRITLPKLNRPAAAVVEKSAIDHSERLALERARRAKKRRQEMEEKLLMGD